MRRIGRILRRNLGIIDIARYAAEQRLRRRCRPGYGRKTRKTRIGVGLLWRITSSPTMRAWPSSKSDRASSCAWARIPFDHPHVFLDLGDDNEIICPYCSTLYRYAKDIAAGQGAPARMRGERQGSLKKPVADSRTIVVAGAGIGGLTTALALAARADFASSCSNARIA